MPLQKTRIQEAIVEQLKMSNDKNDTIDSIISKKIGFRDRTLYNRFDIAGQKGRIVTLDQNTPKEVGKTNLHMGQLPKLNNFGFDTFQILFAVGAKGAKVQDVAGYETDPDKFPASLRNADFHLIQDGLPLMIVPVAICGGQRVGNIQSVAFQLETPIVIEENKIITMELDFGPEAKAMPADKPQIIDTRYYGCETFKHSA